MAGFRDVFGRRVWKKIKKVFSAGASATPSRRGRPTGAAGAVGRPRACTTDLTTAFRSPRGETRECERERVDRVERLNRYALSSIGLSRYMTMR